MAVASEAGGVFGFGEAGHGGGGIVVWKRTWEDVVWYEPGLKAEVAETEELARLQSDVSRKLAAKRRRTVKAHQRSGMGTRAIADLLELSQQRVSQIARGTR